MKTAIHNIAPSEPTDEEVKRAAKQLGEAIRNMILPKLDAVSNAAQQRAGARPPLALPAEGEGPGACTLANGRRDRGYIAPAGDDGVGNIMPPRVNSKFGYKLPEGD